ncbi:MAG: hypothetical protein LLG03_03725 [Planctomycetaceae bacterium]|nr:hypothetical protein [Planctomycetaceae bacterium]
MKYARAFEFFCRHFVEWSWLQLDDAKASDPRPVYASAFVISVRGLWFMLTAGHVFGDIEIIKARGGKILNSRLADSWAAANPSETIPFDFEGAAKICLGDEDSLDCAIIPLRQYYQNLMRVEPVVEQGWQTGLPDSFDADLMVGIPRASHEHI